MLIPELVFRIVVYATFGILSILPVAAITYRMIILSRRGSLSGLKTGIMTTGIVIAALWVFIFPIFMSKVISFPHPVWVVTDAGDDITKSSFFIFGDVEYTLTDGKKIHLSGRDFHIVINDSTKDLFALPVQYEASGFTSFPNTNNIHCFIAKRGTAAYIGAVESSDKKTSDAYARLLITKYNEKSNDVIKTDPDMFMELQNYSDVPHDMHFTIKYFGNGDETPPDAASVRIGYGELPDGYWLTTYSSIIR